MGSKTVFNLLKSSWHDTLWIYQVNMWGINEKILYICCKIEKNQHTLEIGAVIAGLILPVVIFLIVSWVGVDDMGINNHRISNYPII